MPRFQTQQQIEEQHGETVLTLKIHQCQTFSHTLLDNTCTASQTQVTVDTDGQTDRRADRQAG